MFADFLHGKSLPREHVPHEMHSAIGPIRDKFDELVVHLAGVGLGGCGDGGVVVHQALVSRGACEAGGPRGAGFWAQTAHTLWGPSRIVLVRCQVVA